MNVLLTETDWTHIESILGGLGLFIGIMVFMFGLYKLMTFDD